MSFMPHIMILLGGCCWLAGQAAEPPVWSPGSNQNLTFFSVDLASKPDALPLENKDPQKAGIDFINRLDVQRSLRNQILLNGSGLAIGDVNGDDLPDLYFCGLDTPNALYLNQGQWSFERAPQAGGAECADQSSTGALLADMDGDDDLDLLVTAHRRGVRLFLNNGLGLFEEGTHDWGLEGKQAGASMALGDIQGNGWLDLYVVHYRNDTLRDLPEGQFDIRMKD
ncbi:MAG: FG-GAP repeat domain-containing protein, partial [Limisphaerales bacterium]